MNGLVIALVILSTAVADESQDFGRYQIIIDRSPFGHVTASGMSGSTPGFAQRFQLVGIVTSTGLPTTPQAVLFDKEANRSWFKSEGEMIDGNIRVVKIQDSFTNKAKVMLQCGLETATLTFAEHPNMPVTTTPPTGQPPQPTSGSIPERQPIIGRIPLRRSN